jgi:CO dehydrogenase/acetyl-CoA synthase alpha subunit
MQQIADWLKRLGISEYAQRFVENRIALSVLPDLTDQDLEKLGVLLGDRRKMLRAIRDLGNVSVAVAAPLAPVETEPTRPDDAERRQLVAQTLVHVLKQCGDDLTRENVMKEALNLKGLELGMLLPGITSTPARPTIFR